MNKTDMRIGAIILVGIVISVIALIYSLNIIVKGAILEYKDWKEIVREK